MRHITLQYLEKQIAKGLLAAEDRRPVGLPGKSYPTRVAWLIESRNLARRPNGNYYAGPKRRRLCYIGKPNRYRALEALKFLRSSYASKGRSSYASKGHLLVKMWQMEFDREGPVVLLQLDAKTGKVNTITTGAFWAYHPHSTQPEVIEAFVKKLHVKYIGGVRLYSQKRKLSTDALDAYYLWYKKQFGKGLRRPRPIPTIAGGPVESVEADA